MSDFTPGQRWISDGEANLGLGTILFCDARTVRVYFAASEETRTYSTRQAPLTRVVFGSGDQVESADGETLRVEDIKEDANGLVTYICARQDGTLTELPESCLNDRMAFHQARDKLLTGQVDRNDAFNLRYRSLNHHARLQRHPGYGFSGPKVDLIPHQTGIALDVANRHRPRVLLADEVGLGKTIEAGLILHRMMVTGRVGRTLILVPESLTHQWLVELLRRFGLEARLLDEKQSQQYPDENPFDTAQLVLASAQWLFANPRRQQQAEACQWDMLIVDEAHHLNEEDADSGYPFVSTLTAQIPSVLLLTATPEQLGAERHFALLQLLDPERYHDLETFKQEEERHAPLANIMDGLVALHEQRTPLSAELEAQLLAFIADDEDAQQAWQALRADGDEDAQQQAFAHLRSALLDRHGLGRVMFHHSRRDIAGFPERRLHTQRLEAPLPYQRVVRRLQRNEDYLDTLMIEHELAYPDLLLYPEDTYMALTTEDADPWWKIDPRVQAIIDWVEEHPGEQALVICHSSATVRSLAEGLRVIAGLHVPVFHEHMSLIERDRAAAAFVDGESNCPLLICAEVGAEGRNFQNCHHLIMFDVPTHPDQLEQRIGRLDRIGQQHPIDIHLLTLEGTPMEAVARWYAEGVMSFGEPTGLGSELYDAFNESLDAALLDADELDAVIADTRDALEERRQKRQAGRYRLLAHRTAGQPQAMADLITELDDQEKLSRYLEQASEVFGFDIKDLGGELYHIAPTGQLLDGLPGLVKGEEGFSATFSRSVALERDDVERLSWEHPLVQELLSRAIDSPHGNTSLALLKHPAIPAGRLMTEVMFVTQTPAPKALHAGRFLPPTPIRVLLDQGGQVLTKNVSFGGLAKHLQRVKRAMARDIIKQCLPQLREMLDKAEGEADRELPALVKAAHQGMCDTLDQELARLKALAARTPGIRQDEIDALQQERDQLEVAINDSRLRLDAVRVIVTVDPNS